LFVISEDKKEQILLLLLHL